MRVAFSIIAIMVIFIGWYSTEAEIKDACGDSQTCIAASL